MPGNRKKRYELQTNLNPGNRKEKTRFTERKDKVWTRKEPDAGLPGHKHTRPRPLGGLNGIQGQGPGELSDISTYILTNWFLQSFWRGLFFIKVKECSRHCFYLCASFAVHPVLGGSRYVHPWKLVLRWILWKGFSGEWERSENHLGPPRLPRPPLPLIQRRFCRFCLLKNWIFCSKFSLGANTS